MADLYYYETGYIDTSYFVYTADAESAQTATSSISCDATVIAGGVAVFGSGDLPGFATMTVMISHIEGVDLFAMSNASLAAEVSRIRDNNIDVTSAFTQVVSGAKFMYVGSDQNAEFTITADNLRVRFNEAASIAAFSLAADVEVIIGGQVLEAAAALEITTSLEAQVQRNQFGASSIESSTSQSTVVEIISGLSAELSITSQLTNTGDRIRNVVASLTPRFSTYSQNVAGTDDVIGFFFRPDMESYRQIQPGWSVVGNPTWIVTAVDHTVDYGQSSVITITGGVFVSGSSYGFTIDDSAKTSLTATLNTIIQGASTANALFDPTISIQAIKNTFAVLDSVVELTVVVQVQKTLSVQLTTEFTQSLTVKKLRSLEANLITSSELSATILDLDLAQASLSSNFVLSAEANRYKLISSNLISTATTYARAEKTLSAWGSDSWYKGLTNSTATDVLVLENNVYEVGISPNSGSAAGVYIAARDINRGEITWKINYPHAIQSGNVTLTPKIKSYDGYLYINVGYSTSDLAYRNNILKIDPNDGSIVSQYNIRYLSVIYDFEIDSTGIYITGAYAMTTGWKPIAAKIQLAPSGTTAVYIWRRVYNPSNTTTSDNSRILLRNGKLYWTFDVVNLTTQYNIQHVNTINTNTGDLITHRVTGINQAGDFTVDANENLYFLASTTTPLNENGIIVKVNADGSTAWAYKGVQVVENGRLEVDAAGNVYYLEQPYNALDQISRVIKFNSAGAVVWARTLTNSNGFTDLQQLITYDDRLFIAGGLNGEAITINVPAIDGDNIHTNIPFLTAYTSSGTWSWSDYTPSLTNYSYTLPSTSAITLINQNDVIGENFTVSTASNTQSAFIYLYTVSGIGTWNSTFTQTSAVSRTRRVQATVAVTATQITVPLKVSILNSTMLVIASQTAQVRRLRGVQAQVSSNSSMVIAVKKITGYAGNLTQVSSLTSSPNRLRGLNSQVSSSFNQVTDNSRTRDHDAQWTAMYSEIAAVIKVGQGFIHMDSSSTMTINARKTTDSPQYMFSQTAMTTVGFNTLFAQADISSVSTFSLLPTYLRRNEAQLSASSSLSIPGERIRPGTSSQAVQFFQFAYTEESKTTGYASTMLSTSQLVSNNQILRLAQANLSSAFNHEPIYVGVLVRIEADLIVNGFVLSAGQVLNIDLFYQLKIASETRTLWVEEEYRLLSINPETRVNKIKGNPQL